MARKKNIAVVSVLKMAGAVVGGFVAGAALVDLLNLDLLRKPWMYYALPKGGKYYATIVAPTTSYSRGPFDTEEEALIDAAAFIAENGARSRYVG